MPSSAEERLRLRDSCRPATDAESKWSSEVYEIAAEAAPVWGAMMPDHVIKDDVTTAAQEELLKQREKRGELSAAQQQRSLSRLTKYFNKKAIKEPTMRVTGRQVSPPPLSFFAPCLRIQTQDDVAALVARHKAEEVAHRKGLALKGSQYTVFPEEGRWPTESSWAAMQQVVMRGGFAFRSGMALRRMDSRMAQRGRAPRQAVLRVDSSKVSDNTALSRGVLAEMNSYVKPPYGVQSVLDTVIALAKPPESVPACMYAAEVQDLYDMGFEDRRLSREVLAFSKGDIKAAVKRLMQLERRGVRHKRAALTYKDVKGFKGSAISDDAMEGIMAINTLELSLKSAAAGRFVGWLWDVALQDPPSPQKAGMLVHTLARAQ